MTKRAGTHLRTFLARVATAVLALVSLGLSASQVPADPSSVLHTRDRFPCGRDRVAVDIYEPAGEGPYPGVILLHGSHGPGRAERYYLEQAEDLARHGFVSLFVRYYDRGRKGRGNRQAWSETISGALNFATNLQKVDQERLALVGYSQGAFLALNAAPLDDRVRAVVAFYGGLSPGYKEPASRAMPPTLLFHGTRDSIVPVRRALETFTWLKSAGKPADLVIYKGATHGFNLSSRGGVDELASRDAWKRTLSFLDFYLRVPEWTPAPELFGPGAEEDGDGASLRYFDQDPLLFLPYLEAADGEPSGEFALINPDPSDVPQEVLKKKGKRAKGGKAKASKKRSGKGSSKASKSAVTSGSPKSKSKSKSKSKG